VKDTWKVEVPEMAKIGKAIARAVQGFADANKPGEYEAGRR
jgi:hypothetical protein